MGFLGKVIYREDDRWPFSYVYFDGKEERWQEKDFSAGTNWTFDA